MKANREAMIQQIIDYFNEHFKFQKLVNDWEIDKSKVEAMTDEQLENFIKENCK